MHPCIPRVSSKAQKVPASLQSLFLILPSYFYTGPDDPGKSRFVCLFDKWPVEGHTGPGEPDLGCGTPLFLASAGSDRGGSPRKLHPHFHGWPPQGWTGTGDQGHGYCVSLTQGQTGSGESVQGSCIPVLHNCPSQTRPGPELTRLVSCCLSSTTGLPLASLCLECQNLQAAPPFLGWPVPSFHKWSL